MPSSGGNTVYGGNNRSRFFSSSALARRAQPAPEPVAQSVTNLNEIGNGNPAFYERISSRFNDIIDEIDNEVFDSQGYAIGMGLHPSF
jgi:hypothetical protein